jgi:hypothetical protein
MNRLDNLQPFTWTAPRNKDGYSWQDCMGWPEPSSGIPVAPDDIRGTRQTRFRGLVQECDHEEMRVYKPLKDFPTLYCELADTEPTEEGILTFVNRYGSLDRNSGVVAVTADIDQLPTCYRTLPVEPLESWKRVILWLKEAVMLWEALSKRDRSLRRIVQWKKGRLTFTFKSNLSHFVRKETAALMNDLREGDVYHAVFFYLADYLNRHLARTVSPQFIWDGNRMQMEPRPNNLLGCTYLQFAEAIDGRRIPRRCEECRMPLRDDCYATTITCSPGCRQKRSRRQRAEKQGAGRKSPRLL